VKLVTKELCEDGEHGCGHDGVAIVGWGCPRAHKASMERFNKRVCGQILLGKIHRDNKGPVIGIMWSEVVSEKIRRGFGTKMYEAAAQLACRKYGLPLASDTTRSDMADGFWWKQWKKGRAEKRKADGSGKTFYALTCPAPKSLKGVRRRSRR
jgi:hypothetical protein